MLELSQIAEQLLAGKEGQQIRDISEQSVKALQEGKIPEPDKTQFLDNNEHQKINRALLSEDDYRQEVNDDAENKDWAKKLLPDEEVSGMREGQINEKEPFDEKSGEIYKIAGVDIYTPHAENLRGKEYDVYRLNDLDPNFIADDGTTNLEKMKKGNAPYVLRDGEKQKIELHHHGQQNDGPLVELDVGIQDANEVILHPNREKGSGRGEDPAWNRRREEHWQNRAHEFIL